MTCLSYRKKIHITLKAPPIPLYNFLNSDSSSGTDSLTPDRKAMLANPH